MKRTKNEKRERERLLAAIDEIAPNRVVVDRETWLAVEPQEGPQEAQHGTDDE